MALAQRQASNEHEFKGKSFRVVVFDPDQIQQGRLVEYLENVTVDGVRKFPKPEGTLTVRETQMVVNAATAKNRIDLLIIKFEHPTMEELDILKCLAPCERFPVVGVYERAAETALKEDFKVAETHGLYCTCPWDYYQHNDTMPNKRKLASTNGTFQPMKWSNTGLNETLSERLLRVLYRVHVAQNEFDIVFGDNEKGANKMGSIDDEDERRNKIGVAVANISKKLNVHPLQKKKRADSIVKTIFGNANPDVSSKIKSKLKMLRLNSWHKRFGRVEVGKTQAGTKGGITQSLQLKARRKSTVAKMKLKLREPIAAARDVLQEEFLLLPLPQQRCSYSDSHLHKGVAKIWEYNYRGAVSLFSSALVKNPEHFFCRFYRALAYGIVGRFRWARADFKLCLRKRPENLVCRYNLALASLNCHMHRRAAWQLKVAGKMIDDAKLSNTTISSEVRDAIWRLRGLVNRRRGDYDNARKDYVSLYHVNEHEDRQHYNEDREMFTEKMLKTTMKGKHEHNFVATLSSLQIAVMEEGHLRSEDHLQQIDIYFHKYHFYTNLKPNMKLEFCKAISYEVFEPGNVVYKANDVADGFYIVLTGSVTQKLPVGEQRMEQVVKHFFQGDTFGELGTIDNHPRVNSVYVREAAELLHINHEAFYRLQLYKVFLDTVNYKRKLIVDSGLFHSSGVSEEYITQAAKIATFKTYERNETITHQGRRPNSVFFQIQGISKVVQKADKSEELEYQKRKLVEECKYMEQNYAFHHSLIYDSIEPLVDPGLPTANEKQMFKRAHQLSEVTRIATSLKDSERTKRINGAANFWGGVASLAKKLQPKEASKTEKKCEVGKLLPPSFFGHSCLLANHEVERASVITETRVVVLRLYVSSIDLSVFGREFREKLPMRMPFKLLPYQGLLERHAFETGWETMSKEMILQIPKGKWDLKQAVVMPIAGGKFQVVPKPKPFGAI